MHGDQIVPRYQTEMLLAACKVLTKEQLENIPDMDGFIPLIEWYADYLLRTFIDSLRDNPDESINADHEMSRIGYILHIEERGHVSCKRQKK